jgi:general secretion pathway protein D
MIKIKRILKRKLSLLLNYCSFIVRITKLEPNILALISIFSPFVIRPTDKAGVSFIKYFLLIFLVSNIQADKVDVTLREFANIVADQNKINILISHNIKDDKILFLLADKSKAYVMLPAFQQMLFLKDLQLTKNQGFYYIDKIPHPEKEKFYHTVTLQHLVYEDVNNLLKINDIKSSYIKSTNSVGFMSTLKKYNILKKYIKDLDVEYPQIQFKINIFYTNIDNLKDRGFNLSLYKQSVDTTSTEDTSSSQNLVYYLNLITMPYSAPTNVVDTAKNGFYAVVKYLDQNGFTEISNSPVLTARSHSKVSFSSVKNIPYLVSSVTNENADKQTTESLEYKDVGLKIDISPIIINDIVNFELNLVIEELTTTGATLTPTTEKRELNSSYRLKRGEMLILSGVNRETTLSSDYGVPLLKDIWLLGELFKYKSKTKTKETLTISIEVL